MLQFRARAWDCVWFDLHPVRRTRLAILSAACKQVKVSLLVPNSLFNDFRFTSGLSARGHTTYTRGGRLIGLIEIRAHIWSGCVESEGE